MLDLFKQKGIVIPFFLFLFVSLVVAVDYTQDYNNALTRGLADTLYCRINGDCTLNNLTVTGGYFNVSVVDYNVTGNMQVSGNVTADYYFGDGSKLTNVLHLNQDNWFGDSWITYTQPNFIFNESKLSTQYFNVSQYSVLKGTIAGNILYINEYDGTTINITEEAGSPALDIYMNFTGITEFNTGVMRYKTSTLAGSYPIIYVWDYAESEWEEYPPVPEHLSFITITEPVYDWDNHIQDGVVQMRIYKASNGNTNNKYYIDWVQIAKGYGTPSGEEADPYSIHIDKINETYFYYDNVLQLNTSSVFSNAENITIDETLTVKTDRDKSSFYGGGTYNEFGRDGANYIDYRNGIAYFKFSNTWSYGINDANFYPYTDNTRNLGYENKRWINAYVSNLKNVSSISVQPDTILNIDNDISAPNICYDDGTNCSITSSLANDTYLKLDQTSQQTVVGKPKFKNGIELTDEYGYGYTNFIYTDDYGDLVLDAYSSGSAYICVDPYCSYYIDSSMGYTNLYVDYAYYADSANYAYYADTAGTATSAGNADTVDSIHASATATANYLYPLDSSGNAGLTKTTPKSYLKESTSGERTELSKVSDGTGERINEIISFSSNPYYLNNTGRTGTFSSINLGTVHTIAVWVKDVTVNTGKFDNFIFSNGASNYISTRDNQRFGYRSGGGQFTCTSAYTSGWSRFVAVRNGGSLTFYKDGSLINTQTGATGDLVLDEFMQNTGVAGTDYNGGLEEIVITSDAKDQAWVTADYNSGAGKYYLPTDTNVLHIWHLDEGTGTSLADSKSSVTITLDNTPDWKTSDKSTDSANMDITIWKHYTNTSILNNKGILEIGETNLSTKIMGVLDNFSIQSFNSTKIFNCGVDGNGMFICSESG